MFRQKSWISIARRTALALLALSLFVPLYSFPGSSDKGPEHVFVWKEIGRDAAVIFVFAIPLLVSTLLGGRWRRPWSAVVLAIVPVSLLYSAMVAIVISTMARSWAPMPWPLRRVLPGVYTSGTPGVGFWAIVAAHAILLALWCVALLRALRGRRSADDPVSA